MKTVPPLVAGPLILLVFTTAIVVYQYWKKDREAVQQAAARLFAAITQGVRVSYLVARWPITLVISWVVIFLAACCYLPMCLAWVLIQKVRGEPAKINIKLA
jgi:uncharacterized membrane protein YfcA